MLPEHDRGNWQKKDLLSVSSRGCYNLSSTWILNWRVLMLREAGTCPRIVVAWKDWIYSGTRALYIEKSNEPPAKRYLLLDHTSKSCQLFSEAAPFRDRPGDLGSEVVWPFEMKLLRSVMKNENVRCGIFTPVSRINLLVSFSTNKKGVVRLGYGCQWLYIDPSNIRGSGLSFF